MEPSTARVPEAIPDDSRPDRRRRVRYRLHTPVYASFNGPQTGTVLDLSELLDLHEEGFCVQTGPAGLRPEDGANSADRLEVNHPVTICLDLAETHSYMHGSGVVVWRDNAGRTGVRLSFVPEREMAALKEWLFVNLLIGCTNHLTRTEQLARYREEEARAAEPVSAPAVLPFPASAAADERARLLSDLDEARREIREAERREGAERVLELIVERAMKLTGASGAALGLFTEGRVVCRGRAGDPAPPLGSEVDVRQGLSGECVRSGQVVLCEDTQDDPRADAELCRSLGIGSLLAVPIMAESGATGLLEIFSPQARSFTKESGGVLERLAELVPNAEMEVAVAGDHIATGALVGTPAAPAGETRCLARPGTGSWPRGACW